MPFYEYHCPDCQETFTLLRSISDRDEPAECPECGHRTETRAISVFATSGSGERPASSSASDCGSGFS